MLQDESEKDIDLLKKQIGSDIKTFVKTSSNDYLTNLKTELMKGFKTYFDQLNTKIAEECLLQETQQKGLIDKIDKAESKASKQTQIVAKRGNIILREAITHSDYYLKIKIFDFLKMATQMRIKMRQKKIAIQKIVLNNKKKRIFTSLKQQTLQATTANYEKKLKSKTNEEITKLQLDFNQQKEEMLQLIAKGEEKLKHENRKKIQVKLLLDQMVLRGISALNLQAMNLSHNSLKEVVKCDYNKEIDTKYRTMLFPETNSKAMSKLK